MALVGDLQDLSLADIIQSNCIGRNNCRIFLRLASGDGVIHLQDGEIVDAQFDNCRGAEAVYQALRHPQGSFRIDAVSSPRKRFINQPWAEILRESMRQIDAETTAKPQRTNDFYQTEFQPATFLARVNNNTTLSATKNSSLVGRTIAGKYRLEAKIKDGNLGTTYKADNMGMEVAVKILHPFLVDNPDAIERFRHAAHAAARLNHPNAISVLDFGVDTTGLAYIVMEYIKGETLRQYIDRHLRIPLETVNKLLRQICAAVEAAHREGIIHRDLKPENILITGSAGQELIKVVDFGLYTLKSVDENGLLTACGLVIGTHNYMSPELFQGLDIDLKTDIYSIGVILYEIIAGQLPFNDPTPVGVALKHISIKPASLLTHYANLPANIDQVVLCALDKDPKKRQKSAFELATQFQQSLIVKESSANNSASNVLANNSDTTGSTSNDTIGASIDQIAEGKKALAKISKQFAEMSQAAKTTPLVMPDRAGNTNTSSIGNNTQANIRQVLLDKSVPPDNLPLPPIYKEPEYPKTEAPSISPPATKIVQSSPKTGGFSSKLAQLQRSPFAILSLSLLGAASVLAIFFLFMHAKDRNLEPVIDFQAKYELVSGGSLAMGRNVGKGVPINETPSFQVNVQPFYLSRYEVTNVEYQRFVKAMRYRPPIGWNGINYPTGKALHPVTNITWQDTQAYCQWLSATGSGHYRLPTEAEWEFAARSSAGYLYPWGNSWNATRTVCDQTGVDEGLAVDSPQLSGDLSAFKIVGMAGNVSEWTASKYALYPGSSAKSNSCEDCYVFRGGNFESGEDSTTTTFRGVSNQPNVRIGFRVVKEK